MSMSSYYIEKEELPSDGEAIKIEALLPRHHFWWVKEGDNKLSYLGLTSSRVGNVYVDDELGIDLASVCKELNALTKQWFRGYMNPVFSCEVSHENKVQMIKEVRASGMIEGLREAKEYVERYLDGQVGGGLPFVLYEGVEELEGWGYLPFKSHIPLPVEAAEVFCYQVAEQKQRVLQPQFWAVEYWPLDKRYETVPDFGDKPCLGWDPASKCIVNWQEESVKAEYWAVSSHEATCVAKVMNKALAKGKSLVLDQLKGVILSNSI